MICLILALPAAVLAETGAEPQEGFPLPAHRSVHDVLRNGSKIGEVHAELSRDERGIWFYETETRATSRLARMLRLSAEESAHFLWRDNQILPLTYRQVSRAPIRTRFWQHELDWSIGSTRSETHEGPLRIKLEEGLLDPLTLRLQLAATLSQDESIEASQRFRVLERDQIEDQRIDDLGQATVTLAAGCFQARQFRRFRREGSSRNYLMWLSPAHHWLPLKIDLDDDDDRITLRLASTTLELPAGDCEADQPGKLSAEPER